jgi:hypothetical protein
VLEQLQALPCDAVPATDAALVWLMVYSPSPWQNYLAALVPVKGILDKAGKNIKSFGKDFTNVGTEMC